MRTPRGHADVVLQFKLAVESIAITASTSADSRERRCNAPIRSGLVRIEAAVIAAG